MVLLLISACDISNEECTHELRVRNLCNEPVVVSVGGHYYGTIIQFTTTGYQSMGIGSFGITGNQNSTNFLTFRGYGYSKWTLELLGDGTTKLIQE